MNEIISELRKNARVSMIDVAKRHGAPLSTTYDRARRSERFIRRYTVLLDFAELGYSAHVHFIIKDAPDSLAEHLRESSNVNNLHRIMGSGLTGEAYFSNLSESEMFFNRLSIDFEVEAERYSVLEELKREAMLR